MPILHINDTRLTIEEKAETRGTHVVNVNGKAITVRILRYDTDGRYLIVETKGKVAGIKVGESLDGVWVPVQLNGREIKVRLVEEETPNRSGRKSGDIQSSVLVTAPMAGKIVSLRAEVGSKVKEGNALVVLEAMKMENEIAAPKDGRVKEVFVKQGASVKPGDKIAVID